MRACDDLTDDPTFIRASKAAADSFRMLDRIVKGEAPQIDEHDEVPGA